MSNILVTLFLSALIAILVYCILLYILSETETIGYHEYMVVRGVRKIILLVSVFVSFLCSILLFIELWTNIERQFAEQYKAQKQTIESSLYCEELTGLERIELVKQATELNGELAKKKMEIKLWYNVVYDRTIYDNIDFIEFDKKGE